MQIDKLLWSGESQFCTVLTGMGKEVIFGLKKHAKRCWGGGGAAGLRSAVGAVFWRGVTHVGGCNQKMWHYATLQICLGRASRMARAGVRENAELETRVAKRC